MIYIFTAKIDLQVSDTEIKQSQQYLEKYCPLLLTNSLKYEKFELEDRALCIAKAIDIKNNTHNLLLLLYDTYLRYRMDCYIESTLNDNNNDDKYVYNYDIPEFWKDYAYAQWLELQNNKYESKQMNYLRSALSSISKRLIPRMTFKNFNYEICDILRDITDYAVATSKFISFVYILYILYNHNMILIE